LKQADVLPPTFNFALAYANRGAHVNNDDLKLNDTLQLLVHANDVNTLDRSIHTIKINIDPLVLRRLDYK
jgi:hypothetical protein